ncbi:hypothetical protein AGLY_018233 [Aphis glycines]|uniref:Uncharacterized protein n=1 Tax=Aphis glycines TaxID=307491 RepID=A0A6G0SUM6_APHGL|nr:hypothetical protein AGLY_018233 [Aphis glycines]
MQFRINNRGTELSDYTEILNEHVSQLNQKTREKGKQIDELKRQLIERDREYKREINQLRENIQQINITGRKNKSVNFDDEEINNGYNNNNYNYNEDRGRSYRTETNYRGQRREYRDKSPYPERFNYRSRESSRNRQYGRDRSLSRERHNYNNIQNETKTNQDYERKPSYKYVQKNYEHRDNSRDREPNINTNNGRGYRNRSHSRDRDNNREYNYSNRHQYSREHSREKTPERYRGDRYSKEAERIICYRCDKKDTGSNISCIEYFLIKNKEEIVPEKQTIITSANDSRDNINNIKMDKIIWAEHNGPPTILYKTEEVDKMTNEHIIQKIIVIEDTLMPPKILTNIKIETNIGAHDEQSVIHPVDRLSQKHYLKLETNKLGEKTTKIQLYNFSNLYTKFMILIIASAIAEEKISITISSGAFFNEVPEVIVYEKTTEKQIKNFYTNEDKLKQQADKLRDVFVSDHKDLNQITSQ